MGGNRISERLKNTRIKTGYCLICGAHGKLTDDHVPPKGSIHITSVEQKHITEVMGVKLNHIKGVRSPNGSRFKTICAKCNNEHVGRNDLEVSQVCEDLTKEVNIYFNYILKPKYTISVSVNPVYFSRALIGHILAATSCKDCRVHQDASPYLDPLKGFVLGDDNALKNTHDIYYWFYPFSRHVSAKTFTFYNKGHISIGSLLSFFPISFLITKKSEGLAPIHANKLLFNDKKLMFDLSSEYFELSKYPFIELKGNQLVGFSDQQVITSYPI